MFGIFRHGFKITNTFSSRCLCFFCRFESLGFCADSYITTPPKGDGKSWSTFCTSYMYTINFLSNWNFLKHELLNNCCCRTLFKKEVMSNNKLNLKSCVFSFYLFKIYSLLMKRIIWFSIYWAELKFSFKDMFILH